MNTVPVIQRLRDNVAALKLVGGGAQLASAQGSLTTQPAAFVVPGRDTAQESPYMDGFTQQAIATEFAVILAVRDLSDASGTAAVDSLQAVRAAVRDALLGWTPDDCDAGCEFVGGELVDFTQDAVLWWNDVYRTAETFRSI